MVACLSCSCSCTTPFSSTPRTTPAQALVFLQNHCNNLYHLKLIHARIIRSSLSLHHHQSLARNLLHLYFSFHNPLYATRLFHQIGHPHTFTWNLMIRAYTIHASPHQALHLYNLHISQGFPPDKFTFPFVIKACLLSDSPLLKGKEVFALAIKTGFSKDTFLQNTLMDLFFKSGDVHSGRKVFNKMPVRNVISWTTFIVGLVASGKLDEAQQAFDQMPARNVVSWTAMIDGYVRNERPQDAFQLFWRMQLDNIRPNEFTLVSLLKASTQLGSLKLGGWIHDYAVKNGFELGAFLGTALIHMYSKCGSLEDAKQVFDKMQLKTVATWNAMITSYGVHGFGKEALALFTQMEKENVRPDAITFVGVLCACVHTNNVEEGDRYFKYMMHCYGIEPVPEHYTCMVELYGRANMSNEIYKLSNGMP